MTNENPRMKNHNRNQYQLRQPLPKGAAAEILSKTREFIEFLDSTKTTTHPVIRSLRNSAELQLGSLVGLVEAERWREEHPR